MTIVYTSQLDHTVRWFSTWIPSRPSLFSLMWTQKCRLALMLHYDIKQDEKYSHIHCQTVKSITLTSVFKVADLSVSSPHCFVLLWYPGCDFLGFRLQGPHRIIFTASPDCRESFSSTPDLKQGINKEQIFMTKFWMSTKKQQTMSWDFFFLFSMKHCTISDFIWWWRGYYMAIMYVLKGEYCGF